MVMPNMFEQQQRNNVEELSPLSTSLLLPVHTVNKSYLDSLSYAPPPPSVSGSDIGCIGFLIQALTLIIATFGFYLDFFITFDRSNWRRIIRDAMDGTHPKVL